MMPVAPNRHADQTTETLAIREYRRDRIPLACPSCGAVSHLVMGRPNGPLNGACEPCLLRHGKDAARLLPVDADGTLLKEARV